MGVLASIGMYAQYEVGNYIYTTNARYKVTEIVDIAQPVANSEAWSGSNLLSLYEAVDADDYNGVMFEKDGATEEDILHAAFDIDFGSRYILTFRFMGGDGVSTVSSLNATGQDRVDAWVSLEDSNGPTGTANVDYLQVASTFNIAVQQWTEVSWTFQDTLSAHIDGAKLNILFGKMTSGNVIAAGMQLVKVEQVYDIRIAQKRIDFVTQLMEDSNFNTAEAADKKSELEDAIRLIQELMPTEDFDDVNAAADLMAGLDDAIEGFLGVTSDNLRSQIQTLDFASLAGVGRGRNFSANTINDLTLEGGNWGHIEGSDAMRSGIQRNYANNATIRIKKTTFPAGKYFFSAEMRNALPSAAWPCEPLIFSLTTEGTQMWVGNDTITVDPLVGEDYQSFYIVGEVAEDGAFEAAVYWPGVTSGGGVFEIRNVQLRGFGVMDKLNRLADWTTFLTQYNAATNAINAINEKLADSNYPYAKDSLQNALAIWKPYYDKVLEDGWIDADGNDTGVAKNAELLDWALYQGVELYNEPEGGEEPTRLEYQVVRNLQWANNYSTARNQIITDFNALVVKAEAEYNDDMNQDGDKATFEGEINDAKLTIAAVLASATDDTYETDSITLAAATEALNEAIDAFKKSAELKPFIDIDFENGFTAVYGNEEDPEEVTGYYVAGAAGKMEFSASDVQIDNTVQETKYEIGFEDRAAGILHMGNGAAYVNFSEEDIPTDEDVIRITFDMWIGNANGHNATIEFQNSDEVRVAGFQHSGWNGNLVNDFNDASNTGLDIAGATGKVGYNNGDGEGNNAGIARDANRSSFDLIIDLKAETAQASVSYPGKGTTTGNPIPLRSEVLGNKQIVKMMMKSEGTYSTRHNWFDNLKIYKYKSSAEESVGIDAVNEGKASNAAAGIYTITGVKVNALQKGFNIVKTANGQVKKVFIE